MTHEVFISFSFKDREKVNKIVNHLTNIYNIPCWICTEKIRAGENFYREIIEAIEKCKLLLLVQTKASAESREVGDEIFEAIAQNKKIVPFIIEDSVLDKELQFKLRRTQHIDGRPDPFDERIKELARELCRVLNRPFPDSAKAINAEQYALNSTVVELAKDDIFIGRYSLLDEIHLAYEKHNTVFLKGMGGIGKSELAKQYYYKYMLNNTSGYYDKVVFARYDGNLEKLIADDLVFNIKGVSRKIRNINGKDEKQSDEEYAREKISVLKKNCNSRTLIIIDNFDVDADDEPLFAYLADKASYRILVTTRNPQTNYKVIPVEELDDEDLKTIFIAYCGERKKAITRGDPYFAKLFDWTERHTLTIELIAKYMKNSIRVNSIRDMLDLLNDKHLNVFSSVKNRAEQKNSFDRIKDILRISNLGEDDIYFLRCLALMPASGIKYLDFFEKWISLDDDLYWDDVLYKLADLGIVKESRNNDLIYLHPIIREIMLNEYKPTYDTCKSFIDKCTMVGEDIIPVFWNLTVDLKETLFECYKNILNVITELTLDTYPVYVNISLLFNYISSCEQAIALHERIYDFTCENFGKYTTESMLVLDRMGWKYSNCMMYEKALPYYKTAADWFIENPCYTSREAHFAVKNCGSLYYYLYKKTHDYNDLNNSYDYLNKYILYGEKMSEATHDATDSFRAYLKYQNDVAYRDYFRLHMEEKKYDLAREYLRKFEQAVTAFNKSCSVSADMAEYYKCLASLEYELGNFDDAYEAFKKAYDMQLKFFDSNNPRIIVLLENLAKCCLKMDYYDDANKYILMAINAANAVFEEEHPAIARLLNLNQEIQEIKS